MEFPGTIGRYDVEDVIGQGGMGRVLLARDSVLGRRVAIKIMRGDLGLPPEVRAAVLARMRQEARAAAAVSHPNMVTLHDMGEEEPVGLYLVFEYVEGPTLRQAIDQASPDSRTPSLRLKVGADIGQLPDEARGALDPKTVVRIAREVAGAIDRAHAAGVIHRDVKPENILLSELGAKITDFGIARMPDSTLTLQSTVMGTPAYSAPEALMQGAFSPRSDQFSFACTIYEALTGERAFPGDDALAVATKVASEDPAPLRSVGGVLDRAAQVLMRGLAKDPARRFASCTELASLLEEALLPVIETTPERSGARDALRETAKAPESAMLVVGAPVSSKRRPRMIVLGAGVAAIGVTALLFGVGRKPVAPSANASTAHPGNGSRSAPLPAPTTTSTTAAPSASARVTASATLPARALSKPAPAPRGPVAPAPIASEAMERERAPRLDLPAAATADRDGGAL